ncbi:hypothetical protein Nepgr_008838 [Nepenthes gracilis]|uniref:Uncharacterized protein n=1 Tax=Nepenthes gracilis TaxID=150966 RepID=A0AAD3S9P7_NEPGR|nr:hypothetical protein Nepgr_008838 [Nepenthes gracilis]
MGSIEVVFFEPIAHLASIPAGSTKAAFLEPIAPIATNPHSLLMQWLWSMLPQILPHMMGLLWWFIFPVAPTIVVSMRLTATTLECTAPASTTPALSSDTISGPSARPLHSPLALLRGSSGLTSNSFPGHRSDMFESFDRDVEAHSNVEIPFRKSEFICHHVVEIETHLGYLMGQTIEAHAGLEEELGYWHCPEEISPIFLLIGMTISSFVGD